MPSKRIAYIYHALFNTECTLERVIIYCNLLLKQLIQSCCYCCKMATVGQFCALCSITTVPIYGHNAFQRQDFQTLVGSLAAALQMCGPLTHLTCTPIDTAVRFFIFFLPIAFSFSLKLNFFFQRNKKCIFHFYVYILVYCCSECFLRQYLIVLACVTDIILKNQH